MKLEDLGYNIDLEHYRKDQGLDSFEVGRVISEHKERYIVKTTGKEREGEIIGNLRYSANNRFGFPAVDRDFNINRIERYLTICNTSNVKPIIILNKIDLVDDTELTKKIANVQDRIKQLKIKTRTSTRHMRSYLMPLPLQVRQ